MPITSVAVHAFPECKDVWTQLDSTSQERLLSQGAMIWDAPDIELGQGLSKEILHEFDGKGVFIQEDGKWRFVLPQLLFFIQSISLIDSSALHSLATDELIHNLVELLHTSHNYSRDREQAFKDLISYVIAQLVNEFGRRDMLDFLISEETSNHHFWPLNELVCDAFPILDLSVEGFTAIFKGVVNRERGDLAGGKLYWAAEYLGSFRPEFAFELVDYLAAIKEWEAIGFLERLLTGIALVTPDHFDAVVTKGEEWLDSGADNLCQAALYCFQNLTLKGKLKPDRVISRVDSLVSKTDQVRYALSRVITTLGANFEEYTETCLNILGRLKEKGPADQVTPGIVGALPRGNATFMISCLSLLTDVPVADKGTIDTISWLLYHIASSHPTEVWNYLEEWVLAHELRESIAEHDIFLRAIQKTYKSNPGLGKSLLTHWFSASDLRLVEEARLILHELKIHNLAATEIRSMPPKTVIYITEKLLVGRLEGIQMLRLFHSILRNAKEIEKLKDYFSRALWHLVWNYPGSAQEFFDQAIDEDDTTEASLLVQQVIQELNQYQKQRRDVSVAELVPSKQRVEKYLEFQRKQQQEIQRVQSDSGRFPLQQLIPTVVIGRGLRTFHMDVFHPNATQRRTFSEPRGFGEFSASIELPRGRSIDPEGESWLRYWRFNCKPDDIREEGE